MKKETFCEILGEINDDYIKEAQEYQAVKRHPHWRRWTAAAACLVVAAVLSGVMIHSYFPARNNSDYIVLNDPGNMSTADMDVYTVSYEDVSDAELNDVKHDFQAAAGISYEDFVAKLPDTWNVVGFSSMWSRDYSGETPSDEYFLHDYIFNFEQTDGDGIARISLCTFEKPLRDCFFFSEDAKPSLIDGVELVIHGIENQVYMTEFSYENVYYDLEISNTSKEEVHELLAGIL